MRYTQTEPDVPDTFAICHDDCEPGADCRLEAIEAHASGRWSHAHHCDYQIWLAADVTASCPVVVTDNQRFCDAHRAKEDR